MNNQEQKQEHSPRLNTILMVEETLKNILDDGLSIADIKRNLPKQVNHNTLKIILQYLEDSNKIQISLRGISWINHVHHPNQ